MVLRCGARSAGDLGPARLVRAVVGAESPPLKPFLDVAIPLVTVALQVVVGLELSASEFQSVRRRPGTILAGLLGPLVLLPPIALAWIALLRPSPEAQAGLLLIAACPVGGVSNTYSYLARASTALSVTLTALSCLLAAATMPLLTGVFESVLDRPFGFRPPAATLVVQLLALLVLPVALGMAVRRFAPGFARRHGHAFRGAAFAALVLLIGCVLLAERESLLRPAASAMPLAAGMVISSLGAGALVGLGTRASRSDRFTMAVEFATRNIGIASAIAISVLGRIEFATFAALYFVAEAPIVLLAVYGFRRRGAAAASG